MGVEEMEAFFGFKAATASDKEVVAAVKKKVKQAEKIEEKPNKTPKEKEMIDYLEQLGLIPSTVNNPQWKDKQKKESDQSIESTLRKMGILAPKEE